jgi:hypothetical protein
MQYLSGAPLSYQSDINPDSYYDTTSFYVLWEDNSERTEFVRLHEQFILKYLRVTEELWMVASGEIQETIKVLNEWLQAHTQRPWWLRLLYYFRPSFWEQRSKLLANCKRVRENAEDATKKYVQAQALYEFAIKHNAMYLPSCLHVLAGELRRQEINDQKVKMS